MNAFAFIIQILILLKSVGADYAPFLSDILAAAGNHSAGKTPKLVFINHFNMIPMSHYPVKRNGPTKETPPNKMYLVPEYVTTLINTIYYTLTVLVILHLLRRRAIDHNAGFVSPDLDESEEQMLEEYRSMGKSERTRLFFYKLWTNHVATAWKLNSTFERDFDSKASELSEEQYLKMKQLKMEKVILKKPSEIDDL
ncbi:unnamed protein product [Caenorhabditis sp. 36 PRJEB53466]|nr:unnamed protein product [Caenorhabditis sp. 36 PRJEB53466]